jgi:hypothetical protein
MLRIDGDLSAALACAPSDTEVVVLTTRGDALRVGVGVGIPYGRASFENGYGACRRARVAGTLERLVERSRGDVVAAPRLLDRLQRLVRANLRQGNDFSIAVQGCLEAAWSDDVPLPPR